MKLNVLLSLLAICTFTSAAQARSKSFGSNVVNMNITEKEIQTAQESWGKALLKIGEDFESGGLEKATKTASDALDAAYGYNMGTVLFKPTLSHGNQTFRTTKEGALAYFVGGNKNFPNDAGFALKGWKKYDYKNASVFISGNVALTTGNVMLTNKDGSVTTVDKTWGFKKDTSGKMRIVLHHSSLPYNPGK